MLMQQSVENLRKDMVPHLLTPGVNSRNDKATTILQRDLEWFSICRLIKLTFLASVRL